MLFAAARGADTAEPGGENVDEALREVEARIQNIRSNAGLTGQQISREFFKDIELIMTVLGPEHVLPPLPPPPAKFVP